MSLPILISSDATHLNLNINKKKIKKKIKHDMYQCFLFHAELTFIINIILININ